MKKPCLLIVEPDRFSAIAREQLERKFEVTLGPLTRKELLSSIGTCDALMVRLGHLFDEEMLAKAKSLKVIGTPTTGLNHVDLAAAKQHGVNIVSLQGERDFLDEIHATAEFTWGLLLALLRKIPAATDSVKRGDWNRDLFRGEELHGKVLGIIGYGRLGTKVANYGRAFGMNVLAYDPYMAAPQWVRKTGLYDLASSADVILVHAAYNESTHKMLDSRFFEAIKPGAFLINTARGELLDESALLNALKNGRLAGAAMDVLCFENSLTDSLESLALITYLRENFNLLITPHVAGATNESMEKTEIFIAKKMCLFFEKHLGVLSEQED